MNIIIVGAGKIGETLTEYLVREKHNVTVIDMNMSVLNAVVNKFDVKGIVGSGLSRELLIDAEVSSCDIFISSTQTDEINILTCVLAKKLGAKKTVARVRDPQNYNEINNLKDDLGLDLAFNPELQTAIEMENVLKFPSAKKVETFADGRAIMAEFDVSEGNPLIGKTIIDISKEYGREVLFGLVTRNEQEIIPHGDFVLEQGDKLHIIGGEKEIGNFIKQLKLFKPKARNVMLIGGGKISYYLAKSLTENGTSVKIVEKDGEKCEFLANSLPKAIIVQGDGTDQNFLEEEGFLESDAVVTLTGIDEENVIISLFAIQNAIDKVVTKVTRPSIFKMIRQLGLDTVMSPRNVIADYVIRFARAYSGEVDKGLTALYKIGNETEALEFTVSDVFEKRGVYLKDLKISKDVLIVGIIRENKYLLPTGESYLMSGDKVVIITTKKETDELKDVIK